MNQLTLIITAMTGGVFLAAQGVFNSHLGVLLKNPLLASVVAFFSSSVIATIFVLLLVKEPPTMTTIKEIPTYLWFTGSLLSVIGISLYYYTIPKLGIATMISFGLTGQILFSVIAGHFGWFDLPVEPITLRRFFGITAMIISIFLINFK